MSMMIRKCADAKLLTDLVGIHSGKDKEGNKKLVGKVKVMPDNTDLAKVLDKVEINRLAVRMLNTDIRNSARMISTGRGHATKTEQDLSDVKEITL